MIVAERAHRGGRGAVEGPVERSEPKPDELGQADEVLDLVGVDRLADVPVAALSLGHCRLVELARALVAEPRLLMADEPSSGLDIHETAALAPGAARRPARAGHGGPPGGARPGDGPDRWWTGWWCSTWAGSSPRGPSTRSWRTRRSAAPIWGPVGMTGCPRSSELDRRSSARLQHLPRPVRRLAHRPRQRDRGALSAPTVRASRRWPGWRPGWCRSSGGTIRIDGEDVTGRPPTASPGWAWPTSPRAGAIFSSLSVEENLTVSFRRRVGRRGDRRRPWTRAYDAFPSWAERRRQQGGDPVGGPAADAVAWPRCWWSPPRAHGGRRALPRPGAGRWSTHVYDGLAAIHRPGTALLVVEQQVDRVLAMADRAVLLDRGTVAFAGPPAEAGPAIERVLAARGEGPGRLGP